MAEYSLNYEYGKYLFPTQNIDPSKYIRVNDFKSYTRGSSFGLKIGIPITLKK